MPLLFLDLDGCLNCHEWDAEIQCGQIHKDKVDRLNCILKSTKASIILSSAWRYIILRGEMTLMGMEWLFRSHGILANRLIGCIRKDNEPPNWDGTPESWTRPNERGQQISDWLKEHPQVSMYNNYAIIDDLDLGISELHGKRFVQTNGKVGITNEDMYKVISILRGDYA